MLTSFRTLNKKNNLISDTFKIIHNKFAPVRGQANAYFAASKRLTEVERTGALNPPLDLSHMCTREGGPFDPTTAFIQPPTTKPAAPVRKNQQSSVEAPTGGLAEQSMQTSPPPLAISGHRSRKPSPDVSMIEVPQHVNTTSRKIVEDKKERNKEISRVIREDEDVPLNAASTQTRGISANVTNF